MNISLPHNFMAFALVHEAAILQKKLSFLELSLFETYLAKATAPLK